jgi:ATP-binding cassette subfamily F protein uup
MNRVCTHTLALNGDGSVQFDVGNYEEFIIRQSKIASALKPQAKPSAGNLPPPETRPTRAVKLTWKEERELEAMDQTILGEETKLAQFEALLSDPAFYKERSTEAQGVQIQCEALRTKITGLYERWETLEQKRIAALQ